MKVLLPLSLYCISLLSLQLQALPVGDRLDLMTRLHQLKEENLVFPDSDSDSGSVKSTAASPAVALDRTALWRSLLFRNPPSQFEEQRNSISHKSRPLGGASTEQEEASNQRGSRSRRHAFLRGQHHQQKGQLMRVGCVLGTCQVQNLSHRLYQLVGQTGREDTSPINPRSPHSYG
ncbi:protein ADM2a [Astyanax mexicanus]|uniref:ADM2 n=2 Tax=Astyanax mexicanus TaxID=7994 RepID=A0A8B9LK51_ASTMX|nr:protein ADM2a [Astyanax mexicanus]KAG9280244.1 ADM2 [Astyanax mexicanus]